MTVFSPPPQLRFIAVAGAPASGKSTYGRQLAHSLGATLLDLDTMTWPLVEVVMQILGEASIDSPIMSQSTRTQRYQALLDTACENLRLGRSVVAVAPFTQERHDPPMWERIVERASACGAVAELHWCDTPAETLKENIALRGATRDASKIRDLDAFIANLDLTPPATRHVRVPWPFKSSSHRQA